MKVPDHLRWVTELPTVSTIVWTVERIGDAVYVRRALWTRLQEPTLKVSAKAAWREIVARQRVYGKRKPQRKIRRIYFNREQAIRTGRALANRLRLKFYVEDAEAPPGSRPLRRNPPSYTNGEGVCRCDPLLVSTSRRPACDHGWGPCGRRAQMLYRHRHSTRPGIPLCELCVRVYQRVLEDEQC